MDPRREDPCPRGHHQAHGAELTSYLEREDWLLAEVEQWRAALGNPESASLATIRRIRDLEPELARKEKRWGSRCEPSNAGGGIQKLTTRDRGRVIRPTTRFLHSSKLAWSP